MSSTLQNILVTLSKMESVTQKNIGSCEFLEFLLANKENFDGARKEFFHDKKSRQVFDWVLQNRLMRSFYGDSAPEILDNIPSVRATSSASGIFQTVLMKQCCFAGMTVITSTRTAWKGVGNLLAVLIKCMKKFCGCYCLILIPQC